jgi:hypothetical protein
MYNLKELIYLSISHNSKPGDVSNMNNICCDVNPGAQTQARAGKCIIHCFYGNHPIEMQIPVFGVKKKSLSLFYDGGVGSTGRSFLLQTPKHSRFHDTASPSYWLTHAFPAGRYCITDSLHFYM